MKNAAILVAYCGLSAASVLAEDTVQRDRVVATSIRSMAAQYCSSPKRTCCVSVPNGWQLDGILAQLRDLPYVRRYDPHPLLGECVGDLLHVTKVEWPKADMAKVSIYFATPMEKTVDSTDCELALVMQKKRWSVVKSGCAVY